MLGAEDQDTCLSASRGWRACYICRATHCGRGRCECSGAGQDEWSRGGGCRGMGGGGRCRGEMQEEGRGSGQGTVPCPGYTTGHQATPTCESWLSRPAAVSCIGWLRWLCGQHCPVAKAMTVTASCPAPTPSGARRPCLSSHQAKGRVGCAAAATCRPGISSLLTAPLRSSMVPQQTIQHISSSIITSLLYFCSRWM